MNRFERASLLIKELGPGQLLDYAVYQTQLKSGRMQKLTPLGASNEPPLQADFTSLHLFDPVQGHESVQILASADEIVRSKFRAFGGEPQCLTFALPEAPLKHWSFYGDTLNGQDIKTVWEPARFGWVFPLCQAYLLTSNERYSDCFWQNFEQFAANNPVNAGPNWASGQEVALRLLPWLAAAQVFANSPESTPQRKELLSAAIWQHTARIPPTLRYARSQNNNHYLSEALGLMIGGTVFREYEQGKGWLRTGFNAFQDGLRRQIAPDGTYSQHSNNYHRLMLHLALVFNRLCQLNGLSPSKRIIKLLQQATSWLAAQYDAASGQVPNLGHNDGSNLLPLGNADYTDYRPTLQAASLAFLAAPLLPAGPWDELARWLGLEMQEENKKTPPPVNEAIHRVGDAAIWGTLRSVKFHSRPAHADQLHADLWWDGLNIAADPGTYAYNLPEPWQNSLAKTSVHNTITVAGQEQMLWAGKFLWLKRAEAHIFPPQEDVAAAILYCDLSNAYTQVRSLTFLPGVGFEIVDTVELAKPSKEPVPVTIQWLLPDWAWQWQGETLSLQQEQRRIHLTISAADIKEENALESAAVSLIRGGEPLLGTENNPIRGWISPTYLVKQSALSLAVTFETQRTLKINSLWTLEKIE